MFSCYFCLILRHTLWRFRGANTITEKRRTFLQRNAQIMYSQNIMATLSSIFNLHKLLITNIYIYIYIMGTQYCLIRQVFTLESLPKKPLRTGNLPKPRKDAQGVFRFLKEMTKYYKLSRFLVCICTLLGSALSAAYIPKQIGKLVNVNSDPEELRLQLLIFLALIIVAAGFQMAKEYVVRALAQKIVMNIRLSIFSSFIKNDIEFFENNGIGSLSTRLSVDATQVKKISTDNLLTLLENVMVFAFNTAILLFVSFRVTLSVLFMFPLYIYSSFSLSKRLKKYSKKLSKILTESSSFMEQRFTHILTISAFHREDLEIKKFETYSQKIIANVKLMALTRSVLASIVYMLPKLSLLIGLWLGFSDGDDEQRAGKITTFLLASGQLSKNMDSIGSSVGTLISSMGSVQKLFRLLQYQPKINQIEGGQVGLIDFFQIQFRNVSFIYPNAQTPVLKNLNLKIKSGEYIGIIGGSGSGKSTLVKLLLRIYDPSEGKILLNGVNIRSLSINSYHNLIGYVSQEPILFSGTIEDNIVYDNKDYVSQEDIDRAVSESGMSFVTSLPKGINTHVGERGSRLSGGQRQRVSIARVMLRRPKMFIFDEVTSALDAENEQIVKQSLDRISMGTQRDKVCVVMIAHRIQTLQNTDRIIVMEGGQIVEDSSFESLCKTHKFFEHMKPKEAALSCQEK